MCLYPKLIKNPKYGVTKKNKGNVPTPSDPRVLYVPVGCGVCMECMKQKANNWRLRITEDIKQHTNGKFITLTFSNESYTELAKEIKADGYLLDNEIATLGVRRFLERWRKKYKKSLRHWLITELGQNGTENVHLHGIVYTDDLEEVEKIWNSGKYPYGWIWKGKKQGHKIINYVSARTANYITKYVTKIDQKHRNYKAKILCSPGIGANYTKTANYKLNKYNGDKTKTTYTTEQGAKMAMPIYWRNKAYTEEEREKLWTQMLDKNERWVVGEKIAADNDEGYNRLVKYYREINNRLGYGSPKDRDQIGYETAKRKLMQEKRMKKT